MNLQKTLSLLAAASATAAFAAPDVTNVQMSQNAGNCKVTITYTLSEPAVVTLDILTNATPNAATGWASIGGEHICNAQGDVWKKVETAGTHTITWRPAESWLDEYGDGFKVADGCAKARVSAWPLDNTPDYMVVDISAAAQPNTQRYYPRVDFLPGSELGQKGAVTNNPAYKSSMLVMRKIMAKDVTWTMGSTTQEGYYRQNNENTHQVTLTNNYYIGIFEVTQSQWIQLMGSNPSQFPSGADSTSQPVEGINWAWIRLNGAGDSSSTYNWPNPPHNLSFLGKLRTRTGIDFDLPGHAQWEFAARAGNGDMKRGDGATILCTQNGQTTDANLNLFGRYAQNGGYVDGNAVGPTVVGSYRPNNWGLYDTCGNVWEWCLDFAQENIGAYNGAVNISISDNSKCLDGSSPANNVRIRAGGAWNTQAADCRPARHDGLAQNRTIGSPCWYMGFRVACQAGLK